MKRTVLTLAALLFAWIFANAQFNFGIKGGYNSSLSLDNISSVQSGTYNFKTAAAEVANGFHGGVFARVGIKKLYIQPEVLYALQKKTFNLNLSSLSNPSSLAKIDNYVTFSTIDVPILVGYKIVDLKLINLRVFAGPKFRLNTGSKLSYNNLTANTTTLNDELLNSIGAELKNSAVGMEAGAGIDVAMFTLDARLNLINDLYTAKWQSKPDLNSNFVISLGWKF